MGLASCETARGRKDGCVLHVSVRVQVVQSVCSTAADGVMCATPCDGDLSRQVESKDTAWCGMVCSVCEHIISSVKPLTQELNIKETLLLCDPVERKCSNPKPQVEFARASITV